MSLSETEVQAVLAKLVDPNTGKDFVATRSVKSVKAAGAAVEVEIELGSPGEDPIGRGARPPGGGRGGAQERRRRGRPRPGQAPRGPCRRTGAARCSHRCPAFFSAPKPTSIST